MSVESLESTYAQRKSCHLLASPQTINSPERIQSRKEHSLLLGIRERIMFQFPLLVPFRRRRHRDC